jgi:hypothetical protein
MWLGTTRTPFWRCNSVVMIKQYVYHPYIRSARYNDLTIVSNPVTNLKYELSGLSSDIWNICNNKSITDIYSSIIQYHPDIHLNEIEEFLSELLKLGLLSEISKSCDSL